MAIAVHELSFIAAFVSAAGFASAASAQEDPRCESYVFT